MKIHQFNNNKLQYEKSPVFNENKKPIRMLKRVSGGEDLIEISLDARKYHNKHKVLELKKEKIRMIKQKYLPMIDEFNSSNESDSVEIDKNIKLINARMLIHQDMEQLDEDIFTDTADNILGLLSN